MKPVNLKTRILVPLTLVATLVLGAFVVGLGIEEDEHIGKDLARTAQALQGYYQAALEERAHKLTAVLDMLAGEPGLRAALKVGDRETLLNRSRSLFERLKSRHGITHLYFHDPQRINLLRVHQPERFGDTIDRFTLLAAERQDDTSHGVELGPLGTFTLRAVQPVREQGQLIGYMELGEEVNHLLADMAGAFGVDLVAVIDKRFLDRTSWQAGMRMLGHEANWGRLPGAVIVSHSRSRVPAAFDVLLDASPDIEAKLSLDERRYRATSLPLTDAGARVVGRLLVTRDVTERVEGNYRTLLAISAGAVVLGVVLLVFFYGLLGRVERRLGRSVQALRESREELLNAQRMAHLGNWEWDIGKDHLSCSDEAARILGLPASDCPLGYEGLLRIIHPDDRAAFRAFIDQARADDEVFELVHRIRRPDGTERTVHHRAEAVHDETGSVVRANATLHDITEQHHAEMLREHLGQILRHSWNEIYTFDAETLRFLEVSDGAVQNLGYSLDELRAMTPLDLKPEFTPEQFEALLGPLRRGEKPQVTFETLHRRKDGSTYPVEVRLQLSRVESSEVFIAIIRDISERKRYIEELEHKALYDGLTDLPNRALLQDRLRQDLAAASRGSEPVAVLFLDILRLQEVNDILGHDNGDRVLQAVVDRLRSALRASDTVARLGGDAFALVLPGMAREHLPDAVNKIHACLEQPVVVADTPLEIELAVGSALYPDHGDTPAALLQHADIALRVAKSEASGFSIYSPEEDPFSLRRLRLLGELRQAIADSALALYYQPKIDLARNRITGVEALARWPHPTEGMISPGDFMPMVEQTGLIRPFTRWVLETAVIQCRRWREAGIDLTVAVNLSTRNLLDPTLPDILAGLLDTHRVGTDGLTLEITESAVMSRPDAALEVLTRLHDMGFKLSIDDFGTGYSSLGYLKRLPVDELKIDYSFVSDLMEDENDAVIVCSTVSLAHNLGLKVVAEGVESKDIWDVLVVLGCDTAQGFYFGRPQSAEQLEGWLADSPWGFNDLESVASS